MTATSFSAARAPAIPRTTTSKEAKYRQRISSPFPLSS